MVRDVIQDGYLIESTVGRPQHFFEWSPRGKKEEVRQQARYLFFGGGGGEGVRDVCGFPRWLATVQTDATIR